MPHQAVSELVHEPIDSFRLTEKGANYAFACQTLHMPALQKVYGVGNVPDPQAAVQDDGTLVIFWACKDWPICMRFDPEQWSRRV